MAAAVKAFFRPKVSTKWAVAGLDFQVAAGQVVGLVGANGAGKTTFLKMAAGLLHPTEGEIRVLGHVPHERDPNFLRSIGMVMGQKSQLWIDIPASETLELLAAVYDIPSEVYRKRLDDLARLFDVKEHLGVQVRRLSLGERMKLEIVAAVLHEPRLLLLDEPTIGLDVVAKDRIRGLVRDYNVEKGTTIVLSSHDMDDIAEVCHRLLIIHHGALRFDGSVSEVASLKSLVLETLSSPA